MIYGASDHDGQRRLESLGLNWSLVEEVLRYGEAERRTYTENDPRGAGEFARWARHVRRMSERLRADGWTRRDDLNQPALVHPSNRWSVIVCGGDHLTGSSLGTPTTKNPKGPSVRAAVESNEESVIWRVADLDQSIEGLSETWVLLTAAREDRLFSEVSLPNRMDGEFISGWAERILLPSVDLTQPASPPEEDEGPSGYEVVVTPK